MQRKRLLLIGVLWTVLLSGLSGVVRGQTLNEYDDDGMQRYSRSDLKGALQAWEQGLALARQMDNKQSIGVFLTKIAAIHSNWGDYPRARTDLEKALQIARELRDRDMEGHILTNIGILDDYVGEGVRAFDRQQQALRIFRELENRHGEAHVLGNLGNLYRDISDYSRAHALFGEALQIFRELRNRLGEGQSLTSIGIVYSDMGDYLRAYQAHEQALAIFNELGNRLGKETALTNIGITYAHLGDYVQALATYEKALQIARILGNQKGEGTILSTIGAAYQHIGDYAKALAFYQQAFKRFQTIGSAPDVRRTEASIGEIYLAQGRLQDALATFKRVRSSTRLGRYYLQVGEYQQAREAFTRSLRVGTKQQGTTRVADAIGLGLALEGLGEYIRAQAAYREAVTFIEQQREGLTESQRRRFFSATVIGFPRLEPYEGLVRVAMVRREPEESFLWAEHTKARQLLEVLARHGSANRLSLSSFLAEQEADLIARMAAATTQMERARTTQNLERYQELTRELARLRQAQEVLIARLQQEYPAYAALRYPRPIEVTALPLERGEVLLAYEVTESATFAWLIRGTTILKALTIPVTRAALTAQVKQYRGFFEGTTRHAHLAHFDPQLGKVLYDLLLNDLAPLIKPEERIVLVPDEILGILPFEALVVELHTPPVMVQGAYGPYPQDVTYVGDLYPIRYAQSATAFHLTHTLKPIRVGKQAQILVVADPVFDLTDVRLRGKKEWRTSTNADQVRLMRPVEYYRRGRPESATAFPRLAVTGQLATRLQSAYGSRVEVLTGVAASEPAVRQRSLRQYNYHIYATHGILDGEVPYIQEPALVLSQVGVDAQERERDGFLTLSEVMGLQLTAEVVALTACNTGVGEPLTGEGVMGLGLAFQYAGARSVLMSQWSVEEESTTLLIERFFTALQRGQDTLEALRQARTAVRQAGYEHPFFWAPFILVGARR